MTQVHYPELSRNRSNITFQDLTDQILESTGLNSQCDSASLTRSIRIIEPYVASPHRINNLLNSWLDLMSNGSEIKRGQSQVHNNGFLKISLYKFDSGWNLRLHVWPPKVSDPRIHDHRWSFASLSLAGRLDAMNYILDESALDNMPRYRLYDADLTGEKQLERIDDAKLRPTCSYRLSQGDFHLLDYRDPHIVWNPTNDYSITLMLSGPAERSYSHSFGPRSEKNSLPAPSVITDDQAKLTVAEIASQFGKRL